MPDIRDSRRRVVFCQLRHARNAHLTKSGNLSESLSARSSAGKSGADSFGYEHGCGVVGLGCTRAKNPGLRAWSSHRNVGLSALSNTSQLRRAVLLRAIRLVIHPPQIPLSIQRSHFRQRQSCFLPPFTITAAIKASKQFRSHSVAKRMSLAARLRNGLPLISQFPRRS